MKQVFKHTFLGILFFITIIVIIVIYAPKGNDYIQWEKKMIESKQMKSNQTQYFNTNI